MKNLGNYIFPINIVLSFIAIAAVAFTMIFLGWKPCPMCLLQQICVVCVFVFSILGAIKKSPKSFSIITRIVILIIICLGIYLAASQTYLQYFPEITTDTIPKCGIDNPFLLEATKTITGSIESCADISEKISGVSLAVYSLIFFIFLLIINCISFIIRIFKK